MTVSAAGHQSLAGRQFQVNSRLLFSLYTIIPLAALTVIVDHLFLGQRLKLEFLPSDPSTLLLWAIVFNFPHIVSSIVTLADKEYIDYYRQRFIKALTIIVGGVLLVNVAAPLVFPSVYAKGMYNLAFVFFAGYTMYHVLSQQFGIGMMLMKTRPTKQYELWRWCATIAASMMYLMVFIGAPLKEVMWGAYTGYSVASFVAGAFVVVASVLGVMLAIKSQRQLGTYYTLGNVLMLLSTFALLLLDYNFFVLAIPRFIHDLTAFMIYSTHDQNRNRTVKHNVIYRWLSFIPIPPLILCPILAVALANSIECGAYFFDWGVGFDVSQSRTCVLSRIHEVEAGGHFPLSMQLGLQVLFICGFFHYYIESFVWKREGIHRHSVSFS